MKSEYPTKAVESGYKDSSGKRKPFARIGIESRDNEVRLPRKMLSPFEKPVVF